MAIETGRNIVNGVILGVSLAPLFTVGTNLLRIKIDSISFTNFGSANAKLTVQIVSSGGTPGNGKILIKEKLIRVNETYTAPEIVGQGINVGGALQALSDTANSINCTATGTEYST